MRVEFHQHENDYKAGCAARRAIESNFLARIFHNGHPTQTRRDAIDGIPTSRVAGFPEIKGWTTALLEIMRSFIMLRINQMHTVLNLTIEHNGHQPLSLGGSFFFRVKPDKELFLEVNFREELDGSCADPVEILGLYEPEDFTLSRILMVGQRKLTTGEDRLEDSGCNLMSRTLARALQNQQSYYKWKGEDTLSGRELRPELPLRAARLKLAMVEEGFHFTQGTLGPMLRHLAEQYLV